MSLPVMPPDPSLAGLLLDNDRRHGSPSHAHPDDHPPPFPAIPHERPLDSAAPVSIDAGTGAALADLEPIDTVPLATAIDRYTEDA